MRQAQAAARVRARSNARRDDRCMSRALSECDGRDNPVSPFGLERASLQKDPPVAVLGLRTLLASVPFRHPEDERGPMSFGGLDRERAAVAFRDDVVTHREAETRPGTGGLGG